MARPIVFGSRLPDETELRLCGDPQGKRAIELGISPAVNALALAEAGAKSIAVDPRPDRIAQARAAAETAGLRVEFHQSDLADLGFATSASIDLVIAMGSLADSDDLSRTLRQVHRVLKPECSLVISTPHPARRLTDPDGPRYGAAPERSISDWFMALYRANFRVDNLQELDRVDQPGARAPYGLVIRARKLGV